MAPKFNPIFLPEQFVINPAATVAHASKHDFVHFCHSVCKEEKAQLLTLIKNSDHLLSDKYLGNQYSVCNVLFLLAELNEVLKKLSQGPSHRQAKKRYWRDPILMWKRLTRGRRKILLPTKTYKMKRVYGTDELGKFMSSGPQTPPASQATSTVQSAKKIFLF